MGIYSHLGMLTPAFAQGKRAVAAGEKLGVVGRTGVMSGTHVYFEMVLAGKPVDPAPYLGVSQCNGEVHQASNDSHHASNNGPDIDEKVIGGRKYYVIFPAGQDYQRQQH